MNRPIKFRGRDIDTGEVIFGDLRHIGIRTYIFKEAQCYYDEELIEVDEDSVVQLVGYDKDGREVYEGDIVWNPGIMSYQSAQLINNYEDEHITLKEATT